MFHKLFRTYNYLKLRNSIGEESKRETNKDQNITNRDDKGRSNHKEDVNSAAKKNGKKIPEDIIVIKDQLHTIFKDCTDIVIREISFGRNPKIGILVVYIDGLIDRKELNSNVLKPLMIGSGMSGDYKDEDILPLREYLKKSVITISNLEETVDFEKTVDSLFAGDTVLYIEGESKALIAGTGAWAERAVEEPPTETVVRGPREGFVESLSTNISLLRRKVKNPKLKFEKMVIGEQTKTEVCICYIQGIAGEELLQMVRNRLQQIEMDAILESGYLEEFMEDAPFSLFPTVGNSEKPDKVAGKILEGRVAILCDGTPFVLTVPYLFFESIQASEDYYSGYYSSSVLRILRMTSLLISILLPGFYVALISFHHEVVPFNLLLSLDASREGVPISPFLELLGMGFAFEILREAGIRLPRAVGQAVSIVGALVLGEASVRAGFISNPVVIITALTAISSFVVTPLAGILPILRIFLLIAGNVLGLLGLSLGLAFIIVHLCSLRSFNVPFMAGVAPAKAADMKDLLVRTPLWTMLTRPQALSSAKKEPNFKRMGIKLNNKESE